MSTFWFQPQNQLTESCLYKKVIFKCHYTITKPYLLFLMPMSCQQRINIYESHLVSTLWDMPLKCLMSMSQQRTNSSMLSRQIVGVCSLKSAPHADSHKSCLPVHCCNVPAVFHCVCFKLWSPIEFGQCGLMRDSPPPAAGTKVTLWDTVPPPSLV